jgi:integrase
MELTASCLRCILLRHVNIFVKLNVNFVNYNVEIGLNMNHLSQNTPYYNKAYTSSKPRLLDQVRNRIRLKHYSIRTEQSYIHWIKRFIFFHNKRHPKEMGHIEVGEFLTHLAVQRKVSASTQNQALNAIVFLYHEVLGQELGEIGSFQRAKRPILQPLVLTREEVQKVLLHLQGEKKLMSGLLYGAGLRLMECLRLRVKDLDFGYEQIAVRDGKGRKGGWLRHPNRSRTAGAQGCFHDHDLHPCT